MVSEPSEPQTKKLGRELQDDQFSSTKENQSETLDQEGGEMRPNSKVPEFVESSQTCRILPSGSHSFQPSFRNKRKAPVSPPMNPGASKLGYNASFCAPSYPNQTIDGINLIHVADDIPEDSEDEEIRPKKERYINDLPHFTVPTSKSHSVLPGFLGDSSTSNNSSIEDKNEKNVGLASSFQTCYGRIFKIASLPSGEVNISLNCNPAAQPVSSAPYIESILKSVENKFIRSQKIVRSQVSVMNLLKELCESYLQRGTDSIARAINPLCLVTAAHTTTVYDKKTSFIKIMDITNGTEKVRISLFDEVGNEPLPEFVYIQQNVIYQNAYVHVSLARIADDDCCSSCLGDCLSSSIPCACARDTGGEYAYTPQGLLQEEFLSAYISMNLEPQKHYHFYCQDCPLERAKNADKPEPCRGHLVRKFIKECWRKCGCSMTCGNRIVQRGITCNLQVFITKEGKGWGLRTLEDLPKGAFVCEYVGEIVTNIELYERNKQGDANKRHTYPVCLDADWGSERVLKDEDALCLDATHYGNVARFINHRCYDANLVAIPVEVESPDHHYYHLAFFTKDKVNALEELTWDYGLDFDDYSHPVEAFDCRCMSVLCRGKHRKG